jgi:bacillaene synthase trans-acting acyltransferase
MKTVLMFSGQGSQYYHMGRRLFDNNRAFKGHMTRLNDVAASLLGVSVIDALYDDRRTKAERFDQITLTSAAIFIVECALTRTLTENDVAPDYLLGTSLGTYAAASLAGCFEVERGLVSVINIALALEAHCQPGSMLSILCGKELYLNSPFLQQHSDLAAVNFSAHFAVSALQTIIGPIEDHLARHGSQFQKLPVTRAFHSRWIDPAREPCIQLLGSTQCRRAAIPIFCCARNQAIDCFGPEQLWDALRRPIQFERTIMDLESYGPHRYVDVGPSGTLATFLKYGLPKESESQVFATMSPFFDGIDIDALRPGDGGGSLFTASHRVR